MVMVVVWVVMVIVLVILVVVFKAVLKVGAEPQLKLPRRKPPPGPPKPTPDATQGFPTLGSVTTDFAFVYDDFDHKSVREIERQLKEQNVETFQKLCLKPPPITRKSTDRLQPAPSGGSSP